MSMKLMSRHVRSAPQRGQGRQIWLQLASTSGNRPRSINARGRFPYTPRAISLRHPMVSPFPFYLLRKGWQDRATIDVAWRDPINRHDWVETGGSRLIRSNGLRMTPRFREIELGSMGLEESCVGAQVMLVRLAQHRARKRRIIRMLQKVRPAKLIVAAYQFE